MPDAIKLRRADRPTEGFTTTFLPTHPGRPVRVFLPSDYQPKYAYPLVVLLHSEGGDEDAAARLAPEMSRRNYIFACPRGPVPLGASPTGRPGFGWNASSRATESHFVRLLNHLRREYHVHPGRVYVVGIGAAAAVAAQIATGLPGRVAGIGMLHGASHAGVTSAPGLRVFVGHGQHDPVVPVAVARRATRQLTAAGAAVQFVTYPTTQSVTESALRDLNRWIMAGINGEPKSPTILRG